MHFIIVSSFDGHTTCSRLAHSLAPYPYCMLLRLHEFIKVVRCNVGAVWPYDRAEVRLDSDLSEFAYVAQRFEQSPGEFTGKIDCPGNSVIKRQFEHISGYISC